MSAHFTKVTLTASCSCSRTIRQLRTVANKRVCVNELNKVGCQDERFYGRYCKAWLPVSPACCRPSGYFSRRCLSSVDVPSQPYTERSCWKCEREIDRFDIFCKPCNVIQMPHPCATYFETMHIEETFDIDVDSLSRTYYSLQTNLHPDRFATFTNYEQELSKLQSSAVNKAYWTLRNPLSRGLYMLELKGAPLTEGEIQMDEGFLIEIMEVNEELFEVETLEHLTEIEGNNNQLIETGIASVSKAFGNNDIKEAKRLLACLQYYDNIKQKMKQIKLEKFNAL